MISHEDIKNLVGEWGLREDIVEKDYVISWVLWGIGSDLDTGDKWIFKGGTCIRKCYMETYRFSEDLDFTVLPDGPIKPEELSAIVKRTLARVAEESGIDFSVREPRFKETGSPLSVEGRIYYRGPRNAPTAASIKLDLNAAEKVAYPPVLRKITHPFPDDLPMPAQIRCYSLEEAFAEKIRAMGERGRPRDLYDIISLFRHPGLQTQPELVRSLLIKKCETKGVPVPTLQSIQDSPYRSELEGEWKNMLGHQLQQLPPFGQFWEEIPGLVGWLEQTYVPEKRRAVPVGELEDTTWTPPPTTRSWGFGIPLESIRFAAANHLCVELGYRGSKRLVEPYSLRRTTDGNLILHAIRVDNRTHRSYRVDRIEGVRVTTESFEPVYQIELSANGPITVPPTPRKPRSPLPHTSTSTRKRRSSSSGSRRSKTHFGPIHIFECPYCGKKFRRKKYDSKLNPHKDKSGWDCSGRTGRFVETRY